ncbi:MAG: DUF4214 domain-containing protein [Acidimicrobiia bacterium]|nr:DUF4214 domain-containing protein [Acidimicrobiia bacterium]
MSTHVPLHAERDRRGLRPPVLTGLVAVALLAATLVASPLTLADAAEIRAMTLPIHPDRVDDVYWSDTYGAPRGGGRGHIGVDMMGEKMIPLLAVRSGTVTWGRFNNARGSILRIRDADGWEYQYIHLNNDSPGTDDGSASCTETFSARLCAAIVNGRFASGTRVTEGEIIGYMGDGGNAEHTRPHLHFEVYKPSGSGSVPINPTASVDAARRRLAESPGTTAGPPPRVAPGDAGFVDHVWFQLHGRRPTTSERAVFESEIAADGVWSALAGHLDSTTTAATVDRLYLAFFHRYPDVDGLQHWVQALGSGREPEEVAEWFADSDEFRARYHGVDFGVFLDRLYLDVLGRQPDQDGKAFWLDELESGAITRGTIVVQFTESLELKDLSAHRNELVALSLVKDGAVPSATELSAWSQLRASASVAAAAASWYSS